jgi:DNA-binding transcriptional LysR family regulator
MAVKLELYRVFREVARTENITTAAQNLFLSQSALSQSIKQLEEELGVRLFTRSTKGVRLTGEGQLLLDYVNQALGLLDSGEEMLARVRDLQTGELTIGASDTVTKTYLVPRLEAFHRAYPGIRLRILTGTSEMLMEKLRSGQVEVAFASKPLDADPYLCRHCIDTHTIFVAAPDYFEDFNRVFTREEIAALPLILLEKKASSRLYVEQYFREHGLNLQPEIELGSHNLLIALARIRLGVACVTEEFSRSGLSRGVIVPLRTDFEIPPRAVYLCTLKGVPATAAAERFMEFIGESRQMSYDKGHSHHFVSEQT